MEEACCLNLGRLLLRQTDARCENSLGKSREPSLKLRPQRSKEVVAEQLCPDGVFFLFLFFVFFKGIPLFLLFIYLFIYFWLCWVFVSVQGLSLVAASGGHSSSRCAGLSLSQPLFLRSTSSRRAGSVVVAHGSSCSAACGIFPDQGSNPCPRHWQADSQPLHHQGSPALMFCSGHCASLKVLLPGLGKPYFHFTLPTFCPYLVEVCTGRSVCLCVSVALFVLQSKKLSNLLLSLNIQPHYIHICTVNLQVCIHVAID